MIYKLKTETWANLVWLDFQNTWVIWKLIYWWQVEVIRKVHVFGTRFVPFYMEVFNFCYRFLVCDQSIFSHKNIFSFISFLLEKFGPTVSQNFLLTEIFFTFKLKGI